MNHQHNQLTLYRLCDSIFINKTRKINGIYEAIKGGFRWCFPLIDDVRKMAYGLDRHTRRNLRWEKIPRCQSQQHHVRHRGLVWIQRGENDIIAIIW